LLDSGKFKQQQGHINPDSLPYKSEKWTAREVTLGAYKLAASQVSKIPTDIPLKAALPSPAAISGRTMIEHAGG
jgi:hypothetical protein